MVAPLSPQDMEDLAAYFASQQVARAAADPAWPRWAKRCSVVAI
jgi:cytochrome c553